MADGSLKQYVFKQGAQNGIPVSGTFELTARCDLNCKMCYVRLSSEEQAQRGQELSTQQWLKIGRQAVEHGMLYLLLTGGEPMLRPDFPQLYCELAKMGLILSVNTNATLLSPAVLDAFIHYPPEAVNVTLYGMSEETYAGLCGNAAGFHQALDGIRQLRSAGLNVILNTTFTRLNIRDMDAIVAFTKAEHIPVRMSAYLFPPARCGGDLRVDLSPEEMGQAAASFDRLTLEPERYQQRASAIRTARELPVSRESACSAGRGAFWVAWDGRMYPCGMVTRHGTDVLASGFSDAWAQTRAHIKTYLLPEKCTRCKYRMFCPSCVAVQACGGSTEDLCRQTKAYAQAFGE